MNKQQFSKSAQGSTVDTRVQKKYQDNEQLYSYLRVDHLDSKIIEKWINEILAEANSQGLKELKIDPKTLRTLGMQVAEISRLYRCLFVYSFGFQEMLKDVVKNLDLRRSSLHDEDYVKGNLTTIQNIWKVFGVLLQQSSSSQFNLVVNQIQKELERYKQEMEDESIRKELQILEMQQKIKEKHLKLQSEFDQLSNQNEYLKQQRDEFQQDYNKIHQSLDEEVTLRVKFEYKINEMYCVHQELQIKHMKLIQEFSKLHDEYDQITSELRQVRKKCEQTQVEKSHREQDISNLTFQIQILNQNLKNRETQIQELEMAVLQSQKMELKDYNMSKQQEHLIDSLQMQIVELQTQIQNNSQLIKDQVGIITDLKVSNEHLSSLNNSNNQTITNLSKNTSLLHSQVDNYTKQDLALRSEIDKLQNSISHFEQQYKSVHEQNKKLEIQIQLTNQKIEYYKSELDIQIQNMQTIKHSSIQNSEALLREKHINDHLSQSIQNRDEAIQDLEKTLSYSQQRLHELTVELTNQETKYRKLESDTKLVDNHLKQRILQLTQQVQLEQSSVLNLNDVVAKYQVRLESKEQEYNEIKQKYHDKVNENSLIANKIKFSERLLQNEKGRNKELMEEITSLKVQLDHSHIEGKVLWNKFDEQVENLEEEKGFIVKRYQNQIKEYKFQMKELIYKMQYEDLLSHYQRLFDNHNQIKIQNNKLQKDLQKFTLNMDEKQQYINQVEQQVSQLTKENIIARSHVQVVTKKFKQTQKALLDKNKHSQKVELELQERYQSLDCITQKVDSLKTIIQQKESQIQEYNTYIEQLKQESIEQQKQKDILSIKNDNESVHEPLFRRSGFRKPSYKIQNTIYKQNEKTDNTDIKIEKRESIEYSKTIRQGLTIDLASPTKERRKNSLVECINESQRESQRESQKDQQSKRDSRKDSYMEGSNKQKQSDSFRVRYSTKNEQAHNNSFKYQEDKRHQSVDPQSHRDKSSSQSHSRRKMSGGKSVVNSREFARLYQITSQHYNL